MSRNKLWTSVCMIAMALPVVGLRAQTPKTEVLKAINECAGYIAHTLIDQKGRSRCDYNLTEGKWYDYEVPWHTGQAIYALLGAYRKTNNKRFLEVAERGGKWWISQEIKNRPGLNGMVAAIHGDVLGQDYAVFATVSDGTPGIYELSRVTKNPVYARVATNAARWMMENMYYPEEGVCYDVLDLRSGKVLKDHSPFWDGKEKQTLNDVSRPNTEGWIFADAYEFSKDEKFRNAHILLSNSLVEKQGKEGVWMQYMPNSVADQSYHPRFSLWYAESLVHTYRMTNDRKYLEAAARTARVFARAQTKDGTIFYENFLNGRKPDKGSITGSAVALAGILWMELSDYGYKEFDASIEKSAAWIVKNRYATDHPDPNLRGAIVETRTRFNKQGKAWLTNRDIGTSFAVRFLVDYLDWSAKK